MSIPVSSPLGFIGIILLGFGLFLVLAGFEIITIQQISVKTGPRTWALGFVILLIGGYLIFPELTSQTSPAIEPAENESEPSPSQESGVWRSITFNIPNDGVWSQPSAGSYFASGGSSDSIAWADEVITGDFKLRLVVKSDFGNYGEGMVIIYGDGRDWSEGCLVLNITGYFQAIRSGNIYDDDVWLDYTERQLLDSKYTMLIEVSGNHVYLYADDVLVASTTLPADASRSGQIGLVKYWESNDVTFSDIELLIP